MVLHVLLISHVIDLTVTFVEINDADAKQHKSIPYIEIDQYS